MRRSPWATIGTVAVTSLLAAILVSAVWMVVRDTAPPADGHAYTGTADSFTTDLANGRVSAVAVDLSADAIDVTSGATTYRVYYPAADEVFASLADHPAVHVTAVTSTSLASVFWTALVTALAGSALTLLVLRLGRAGRPTGDQVA